MNEKLREVYEKLKRHAEKVSMGVALATTLVSCGEKKNSYTFDEKKDYQAMISNVSQHTVNDIKIPEKTFQLDSLEAVNDIASRIPLFSCVDGNDKKQVATKIYDNIRALNKLTEGLELTPVPTQNDPGFGKVVDERSNTSVSGKHSTYEISVETPHGYSGNYGMDLRTARESISRPKNRRIVAKDGIIRASDHMFRR